MGVVARVRRSTDIMDTLATVLDLWNLPEVQDTIQETARIFFTSSNVTVNLIPALLAGLLGLLLLGLIGLPLLGGGGEAASTGYGGGSGYGAPAASYGAPSYAEPSYAAPASGYDAPASGYTGGRKKREVLPGEAKFLYADSVAPHLGAGSNTVYSEAASLLHSASTDHAAAFAPLLGSS